MSQSNIKVYRQVMGANDNFAQITREQLKQKKIPMINIIGSPGAGKTALLEATKKQAGQMLNFAVLEGDVETTNDAERLQTAGIPAVQVITNGGCHLEAKLINTIINELDINKLDLVIIENVGNLVCPAEFDLGEQAKVAVLSVTEGEDKPLKYPTLFREAKAVVLTKIDLLPYLPFDINKCIKNIQTINAVIPIFKISALKNEGLTDWINWLTQLNKN